MWDKLIPMICVLLVGTAWRQWEPGGIPIAQVRTVLNSLIINVLVPALILGVFLNAPPNAALFQVPVVAATVILGGMALSMAWFGVMLRCGWISRAQAGAAVLAASFGNGLGAAVAAVDGLFAEGAGLTRVPLIYEMLANLPISWSLGVVVASWYGEGARAGWRTGLVFLRMPPFWAVLVALACTGAGVAVPEPVVAACMLFGQAAVPLLLFLVGTTFTLRGLSQWQVLAPVMLIRHGAALAICLTVGVGIGLENELLTATAVTAIAPSVAVGIAICERFRLDSALFSAALTATTAVYVLLAPYLKQLILV